MGRIIQFMHPGQDLSKPTLKNLVQWQKKGKAHSRKFLKNNGKTFLTQKRYDEKKVTTDTLYFWGEWEPDTITKPINRITSKKGLPKWIHTPKDISLKKSTRKLLNTDPYVLGDFFYYSNCQQKDKSQLKELIEDDIILFCSSYKKNNEYKVVVDTIFVVDDLSWEYTGKNKIPDLSDTFKNVVINPIRTDMRINKKKSLIIYRGKKFDKADDTNMFSFVPCKAENTDFELFERLDVSNPKFGLSTKKTQGIKIITENDRINLGYLSQYEYWSELVSETFNQQLSLGFDMEEPKIIK